jgi:hypothetical protein
MKTVPFFSLALGVYLAVPLSIAQQPTPTQEQGPVAATTASPQTFLEQIRKDVAFLAVFYGDGSTGVIGTGFFVSLLDERLGENQAFVYLVTNRHVAQPGIDLGQPYSVTGAIIRLNFLAAQGEAMSAQMTIPLDRFHWIFPQDPAVDIAVMPLAPDQKKFDYIQIPSSLITTADQVSAGDVVVGDRVTFAGYFSNFPGQKRVEPIVRQGIIAMLPDENIDTTLHKPGHLYLADLHAFHGNSGSPVFVNLGGAHHGKYMMGDNYRLLGIVSGYYPESVGYSVPAATVLTGEVHDNSGITTIVPADEINKLLNSAELQAERDRIVALTPKRP